ncbi:S41 family peptidase [Salinibius halmophilus]|uniref:S41 family peptidase n=1 Tax=Salinibius halmophilus TaxID=1853216 RepID=UPI000E66F67D|nr:S41 family peptidase [Salinibius halmophilus]
MRGITKWTSALIAGVVLGTMLSVQAFSPRAANELPFEQVQELANVFEQIKRVYVDDVSDEQLIEYAIQGMLEGLDPHSAYLTPKDYEDLQVGTSGQFGGLGIEVTEEDGFVKVITPIDDTPAFRAGIQAGDFITALDGESVMDMSLDEAVDIMRGEPGTSIMLTVAREGESAPLEIEIVRDIIRIQSVRSEVYDEHYGYIRIAAFQASTGDDFVEHIERVREQAGGELKGLIVDLRNNPGGVLDAAVEVSDAMLTEGTIVYTEGRAANSKTIFTATKADPSQGVPIVVLINSGSASASEIVAGALQDQGRAIVMGTESFGKGSVQTILPVGQQTAIKLTTARYYTPNGRSIQATGIQPDVIVPRAKVEVQDSAIVKEADLGGHLMNPNGEEDRTSDVANESGEEEKSLLERDYQLFQALTTLKSMAILNR